MLGKGVADHVDGLVGEAEESAFSLLPAPGGGLLRAVRFSLGVQSGAAPGAGGAVGGLLAARGTVDGVRPHLRRDAGAAPRAIAGENERGNS